MSERAKEIIRRFKEQNDLLQAQATKQQIRESIPTLFAAAGYTVGTYTVVSIERVQTENGDYMELKVSLPGDRKKMLNLKSGLELLMQPNLEVEIESNELIIRKKL